MLSEMAIRSVAHAKDEKAIFEAFLAAHPAFAAQIREFRQPADEFPDLVAVMKNGTEVDFELGEWLDGAQIASAKRCDALAEAIIDAIGPQEANPSRHFRAVMLTPREDAPRFDSADR